MNVAIYVRVSTLEQAEEGYSIDEQVNKLEQYCDLRNWNVHKVYKDGGFTGSNIDRPALQSLILDAKLKRFDSVLVYKLDRLSRSQKDTLYIIEDILNDNDISFMSLNENFDTSTPFGKAMIGILAVFAQLEREQIKERMQMGKLGRAKSGKNMAWSRVPFGYDFGENKSLVINELQASIVRRIFKGYLGGKSISKIRNDLNDEGHIGKDVQWSHKTIRDVLKNPVFKGYILFKNKTFEGVHEPIIDPDAFDKVQDELLVRQKQAYKANNNPRPFQSKYICSGIIRCKLCGNPLSITMSPKRLDGTRLRKYHCKRVNKKDTTQKLRKICTFKPVKMEIIEGYILESIEKLRLNPKLIDKYNTNEEDLNTETLSNEISKLDAKMERIIDLYLDGELNRKVLDSRKEKIMNQQSKLMDLLNHNEENQTKISIDDTVKSLDRIGKSVYELSYEDQKKLVNKLVHRIHVDNESIDIVWNFSVQK